MNTEQSGEGPSQSGRIPRSVSNVKNQKKRKYGVNSVETKYAAIVEAEKGSKSKCDIAKDFNIPPSTLSTWLKQSDKIKAAMQTSDFSHARKRMRSALHKDLDEACLIWFKSARTQNIPLSGPILCGKADELAQKLGHTDFKASNGWLNRFKQRHGITFMKVCGEANSVNLDSDDMNAWQSKLQSILLEFDDDDIFNADETGIFYRMLPNKTLEFKGVQCHGGKQSKERLTALVTANMSGSQKLPLLVIGKSAKPRCFKNVKTLPTEYVANKKAWMTSELFSNWLCDLNKKCKRQKRKIALVIDNCPAHPNLANLSHIKLVFLPPNTTSKTQPMDQGVIQNLKVHYRKLIITRQLACIDSNTDFVLSVLDAMYLMRQAWDNVKAQTVGNCFRHAGFKRGGTDTDAEAEDTEDAESDPEDDLPLSRLVPNSGVTLQEYAAVDEDVITSAELTDEDIIETVTGCQILPDSDADDTSDLPDTEPPSLRAVRTACDTLQVYFQTKIDTCELLGNLSKLNDYVMNDELKNCGKQSKLTDFFM
jgi:transposase-like protein